METPIQPSPEPGPPDRNRIEAKVKPPAIALMVTAIIGLVFTVVGLIMQALGVTFGPQPVGQDMQQMDPQMQQLVTVVGGGAGIVQGIIAIILWLIVLYGATKMMRLESWGLALTAAILAMIPCSVCCVLGLPFGIWAIVVLASADVKAAFR